MSTITTLNNGQSGGVIRGNLNTNFNNLNVDKHQNGNTVSYAGIANTGGSTINHQTTAVSATFDGNGLMAVTNTAAARTITINSTAAVAGKEFTIKDESGGAATFNITVATQGAELINGAATIVVNTNYGFFNLYSDGTNYFVK